MPPHKSEASRSGSSKVTTRTGRTDTQTHRQTHRQTRPTHYPAAFVGDNNTLLLLFASHLAVIGSRQDILGLFSTSKCTETVWRSPVS